MVVRSVFGSGSSRGAEVGGEAGGEVWDSRALLWLIAGGLALEVAEHEFDVLAVEAELVGDFAFVEAVVSGCFDARQVGVEA